MHCMSLIRLRPLTDESLDTTEIFPIAAVARRFRLCRSVGGAFVHLFFRGEKKNEKLEGIEDAAGERERERMCKIPDSVSRDAATKPPKRRFVVGGAAAKLTRLRGRRHLLSVRTKRT